MSFDMWWTFRNILSLEKHVKERKKFLYSIIAWGGPFILIIICIIMKFVVSVPEIFRPELDVDTCLFLGKADLLYDYVFSTICTIISIWLSIHTALKIARYEKDTARLLRDSESRCYNENKKWFNLYLKLFIMLFVIIAIEWIIVTMLQFWLFTDLATNYILISFMILRIIRNIGFFILFVCRKTIMQLLLKHFCRNRRYVSKFSTRNSSYDLEHVDHYVKQNYPVDKYEIRQES
ncbi:probable G-protein coupled receptor Mth-like 1 isoform X2 [Anoplolepis gracilipes]